MSGPKSLRAALRPHGLMLRGSVHFPEGEGGPRLPGGRTARTVVLVGHAGGAMWQAFCDWRATMPADLADPLDTWSKAVIDPIAAAFGAFPYYPSDPPYQPFQRWAIAAEGLAASPLGILAHPRYGLWHGYRAALGFAEDFSDIETEEGGRVPVCESCCEKPCLTACPADAVTAARFDVAACRRLLASEEGRICLDEGCRARATCPVGRDYTYPAEEIRFHMAALSLPVG
ncbi:ferredoxin [Ciceribacter lividus]|uniref:Ferredoxin n=2 Tax=Ciceribacter lividus TaxID=1197950 RepID=A0A6I7HV05_9HYPH|nr:ferredoxin [Ciceribacter lividus]